MVCAASMATFKYASEFIEPIFYRDTDLLRFEIRTVSSVTEMFPRLLLALI